jgi:Protein of unknown function (DUF2637)
MILSPSQSHSVINPKNTHAPDHGQGRHCAPAAGDENALSELAPLDRAQRAAVAAVTLVSGGLFAYGAAGSYSSVAELAAARQMPLPRLVPVGVDGGLIGTALLDIVLTWIGMPLPWLRQLTRALMAATVAANAATDRPDPVATGLHVFAPVLLLAMTEAGRAALLRRLRLADGAYRQPIPLARWVLALRFSFRLWRRMVLWQITSYLAALALEQRRLHAIHRLTGQRPRARPGLSRIRRRRPGRCHHRLP